MSKNKEIEHEYTKNPICPHCGKPKSDAWELDLNDEESTFVECYNCEKLYLVTLHVDYAYSTRVCKYVTKLEKQRDPAKRSE